MSALTELRDELKKVRSKKEWASRVGYPTYLQDRVVREWYTNPTNKKKFTEALGIKTATLERWLAKNPNKGTVYAAPRTPAASSTTVPSAPVQAAPVQQVSSALGKIPLKPEYELEITTSSIIIRGLTSTDVQDLAVDLANTIVGF